MPLFLLANVAHAGGGYDHEAAGPGFWAALVIVAVILIGGAALLGSGRRSDEP